MAKSLHTACKILIASSKGQAYRQVLEDEKKMEVLSVSEVEGNEGEMAGERVQKMEYRSDKEEAPEESEEE